MTILNKKDRILVLLDTCSYEALVKKKNGAALSEAVASLLLPNHQGVITDLSFAELVEGRQTLEEFNSFRSVFLELKFGVFGHSHILSLVGTDALNSSFNTEQEYQAFRQKVIALKNETIKPIFKQILLKYMVLLITVLAKCDKSGYFSHFPHLIVELLSKYLDRIDKTWTSLFKMIKETDKNSRKDALFTYCVGLLDVLAKGKNPNYVEKEVETNLSSLDFVKKMSSYTSSVIKELGRKPEYKHLNGKNNLEFLMGVLETNKLFELKEDEIEFDGTSYAAINSGFCQGKFQFNDLVDIYNVAFIANNKEKFEYYTVESRWQAFLKLEKSRGKID